MPAKERSIKGPIISGIFIGAVMLSPTVPSIVNTVEDWTGPDATPNSRQISPGEQAFNEMGRDMLEDKGYHNIHLINSVLKNPANVHDGLTMTFNVQAPHSLSMKKKVVDCQPVEARVNPTNMICSVRPS